MQRTSHALSNCVPLVPRIFAHNLPSHAMPLTEALALNMNKSDEFIEGRIRWRGELNKLPTDYSYFWESAPSDLKDKCSLNVGNPVLVSQSEHDSFVVICTRGLISHSSGTTNSTFFKDVEDFVSVPLNKEFVKSEKSSLSLLLRTGETIEMQTEKGASHYAVLNIILMMLRMS